MVAKLEAELERERLERNWSEVELNRVRTFWEISKQELDDHKRESLNKDGNAEATEERHQLEIKVRLSRAYQKIIYHYDSVPLIWGFTPSSGVSLWVGVKRRTGEGCCRYIGERTWLACDWLQLRERKPILLTTIK